MTDEKYFRFFCEFEWLPNGYNEFRIKSVSGSMQMHELTIYNLVEMYFKGFWCYRR